MRIREAKKHTVRIRNTGSMLPITNDIQVLLQKKMALGYKQVSVTTNQDPRIYADKERYIGQGS